MAQGAAEIDIDRPVDEVWQVVRDFGGIASWAPGIDSCTVSGDDRTLSLMGMEIVERNYGVDDDARTAAYGIVGGGLPVDIHRATVTVTPGANGGTHVSWVVDVEPDNLLPIMVQTYEGMLAALRQHVGG